MSELDELLFDESKETPPKTTAAQSTKPESTAHSEETTTDIPNRSEYRIYRQNDTNTGCTFKISKGISQPANKSLPPKPALYLEFAPQDGVVNGNAKYNYNNKILFKIDAAEAGKILLAFDGLPKASYDPKKPPELALIHDSNLATKNDEKSKAVLSLKYLKKDDKAGFALSLSKNGETIKFILQPAEIKVLQILLKSGIEYLCNW